MFKNYKIKFRKWPSVLSKLGQCGDSSTVQGEKLYKQIFRLYTATLQF